MSLREQVLSSVLSPELQLAELKRGVVDLHVEKELLERLREGRPLIVKAGFDPTRPDLHLGHTVVMNKMRQFQDLGHEVVFVVGNFTAKIGDPSGRSQTRPVPTSSELEEGAKSYADQAFKILDAGKTRIAFNDDWLGKMRFDDVIRLAGQYTLARMMERDDFKQRYATGQSISLHELLYPLAQAYDSVELACDIELGGTDQLFNLVVGREIMRGFGQRPQIVMTTPLLEGLTAREENGKIVGDKMSKTLDNYVGVTEAPKEQFGKLMSISDALMWRYYELLSDVPMSEITARRQACATAELNPKDAKVALAKEIVARYHDETAADEAANAWESQFSRRETPAELPERTVQVDGEEIWLPKALALAGLVPSSSDGRRRVEQGAVQIDGKLVTDVKLTLKRGRYVIRAGKRAWATVVLK